ncbi:MAG: DUF3500 domain-containing protein [Chloroflexota bacterium]
MTTLNRRKFLGLSTAGAVLLGTTGCISFSDTASNTENSSVSLAEAIAESPTDSQVITDESTLTARIAQAATHFLNGLDGAQLGKATYEFSGEERFRWHWTTPGRFPRNGLPLREMAEEQKVRALDLLKASLSDVGLEKALNIMSLQQDLGNDPELYYVTIFGTPDSDAPWGWRWEGHHLSQHFTIAGDQLATTPFFLGAWPTNTEAGLRAMPREEDAGLELVNSLGSDMLNATIIQQDTLRQHVTQNAARVNPIETNGLLYGDMGNQQQKLVEEILRTYLETQTEHVAQPSLARIQEAGFEQIRFAWAGSREYQAPQYYRLQGASFLLEFDNSRNGGTHIHSVWRDFERDFGYHLL